jgi:hypothetical protein
MLGRVRDANNNRFVTHGGRGITCDQRWSKFENFLADMGERPPGTTLDREDNNKGYCKSNCRWATAVQQRANRREQRNALYYQGKSVHEWAAIRGITLNATRTWIYRRVSRGE